MPKTKVCYNCEKRKAVSKFYACSQRKDGLNSWCKECSSARHKQWRKDNWAHDLIQHGTWYANRVGHKAPKVSIAELDAARKAHNGLCDVCEKPRKLVLEHCHATGAFRGFVCIHCNGYVLPIFEGPLKAKVERYLACA